MPRTITFPKVEPTWNGRRDCVSFYALDDRALVNCLISVEALFSHFGAKGPTAEECLPAFRDNRSVIEEVARRKLQARPALRQKEEILILDGDFPSEPSAADRPQWRVSLSTTLNPGQVDDGPLVRAIDAANAVMRAELSRRDTPVRADWKLIPADGLNLASLTLTDVESGASAQRLYTRDDLEDVSATRFSLLRLWDDMLREKGRRLLLAIQGDDETGD